MEEKAEKPLQFYIFPSSFLIFFLFWSIERNASIAAATASIALFFRCRCQLKNIKVPL